MTAEAFFKELKRLIKNEIKIPVHTEHCENCDYVDHSYHSKNLFLSFDALKCQDSISIYDSVNCRNCVDCDFSIESQLCYESVDANSCYNSNYLENCWATSDSWYSYRCMNSKNLFGCVNLRNKSHCVFNRQLTPEQYEEAVKKYRTWPPEKVLAMVEELKKRYPLTQTNEAHNENTTYGDHMSYNKNCYLLFDATHNMDSGYLYDASTQERCFDISQSAENQSCYQMTDSERCFNCNYVVYCAKCQDSSYIFNCFNVSNCLGAVQVDHKQYVLLNRQLSKEAYEKESAIILNDIKNKNLQWHDLVYS